MPTRIRAHPIGYPITPPASDEEVKNTITLDDLTQITTRNHNDLQTIGSDDHHAQLHVASHESGGADALTLANIASMEAVAVLIDTSGNRPAAGTANRLFVETDTGRILRDDGASWVEMGLSESQISLANLSSRSHSDLSSAPTGAHHGAADHESGGALEITHNNLAITSSDHHSRYTDSEAISAAEGEAPFDHAGDVQLQNDAKAIFGTATNVPRLYKDVDVDYRLLLEASSPDLALRPTVSDSLSQITMMNSTEPDTGYIHLIVGHYGGLELYMDESGTGSTDFRFIPYTDNSYKLGDTGYRWSDGYIVNTHSDVLGLAPLSSAPSSPSQGDVVMADGTNWNPGSGSGVYVYDDGTWQYLALPIGIEHLAETAKQAMQTAPIPTTTLADGEFISFRVNVPSGSTIYIWSVGVQNDANNAPAGLTAEVDDETNTVNLISQNAKRATGTPVASKSGAIDVAFRIENDTGSEQNASGTFAYTIE